MFPESFSEDTWQLVRVTLSLSAREADVAALVLDGCSVTAIAVKLGIHSETVRTYVKRVHRKARARDKLGLLRAALSAAHLLDDSAHLTD